MTNAASNTSTARPETADQSKQMILKEVGAKWGNPRSRARTIS
jgi:hypothetical protein